MSDKITESILQEARRRAAEREKEMAVVAELFSQGTKLMDIAIAANKREDLKKIKGSVSQRLRLESERLKEKFLLLDTLQEQYNLLAQAKEQAVITMRTNKLHHSFENLPLDSTSRDAMWSYYNQLSASEIQHVAEYQTARELYLYLKPHVKALGDKLMQEKREIRNAQADHGIKGAMQTEPVALTQHKSELPNNVRPETATEGNSEAKATDSGRGARLGRPERNKRPDRTFFGLFEDSADAVRLLGILLDRGLVEAYVAGKKLAGPDYVEADVAGKKSAGPAYKGEVIKQAVFKMVGINGNRNEVAALAQTIKHKSYLRVGSTREMARVFSSFFQVDIDESAYRKLVTDDINSFYNKLIPKRLL